MPDTSRGDGPELPEVQMHLHRPGDGGIGIVTKNEICTAKKAAGFVRHLEIDVSKTRLAGQFRSGQSFGVCPPGVDDKGRPHQQRLYSIASPSRGEDGQGNVLSTTVKRLIDEDWVTHRLYTGLASNHLCDLDEGDEIEIFGPNGKRFLLPTRQDDYDYLFIATGTGIAPFRGMLMDLYEHKPPPRSATLIMGTPYATDLMYHDQFTMLDRENPSFTYLTALSRERQNDCDQGLYVQDRLRTHREQIADLLARPTPLVYICGLIGMEMGIFQQMARMLPEEALAQYLRIDEEIRGDVDGWTRKMLHRKIKPTRRVFVEVY